MPPSSTTPQLAEALQKLLAEKPHRLVFSAPKKDAPYPKATITQIGSGKWQAERRSATQAFHKNFETPDLPVEAAFLLQEGFGQLTAFTENRELRLRLTKKGGVLFSAVAGGMAAPKPGHNREKTRLIPEGSVVPPLVDMGIMDAQGNIIAAKRDKYRQVCRFIELVDDAMRALRPKRLRVVDFGCGKSYLTFLLYYYLTNIQTVETDITGLDLKTDVVAHCNQAAARYGYNGLHFMVGDIARHTESAPVDMVVTLHACDTATDHALAKAVAWQSQFIFSVPCCQHELNAQIKSEELAILTRYGLVKERTAALMTDALRANLLCVCGYESQLLEFVGFEHTPKNSMIRARRTNLPWETRQTALDEALRLCRAFQLQPCLLKLLEEQNSLNF